MHQVRRLGAEEERGELMNVTPASLLITDCRLPFNKFIPSYHHHFGRQCKVADYGFSKLIELFEAVPGTVEVTEDADGERLLQLTDAERMQVVGEHISSLIQSAKEEVKLEDLPEMYRSQYGYQLRPQSLGHNTLTGLLSKDRDLIWKWSLSCFCAYHYYPESLGGLFRVDCSSSSGDAAVVRLLDRSYVKALSEQVRKKNAEMREVRTVRKTTPKLFAFFQGSCRAGRTGRWQDGGRVIQEEVHGGVS